ncbi:hypothetical protein H4C80_04670 [Pseudomonas juntendi]|uniref:Uncharacterized protein n=1 Tax=Pseudomonas juntendi TaxID=2666183 RepID=A0A7W2KDC0_9PSED|nr:hypothetical protein [Pseudomonas juntendi]MBA6096439.1 hypothetical protein [Pseudomonas juntendi]
MNNVTVSVLFVLALSFSSVSALGETENLCDSGRDTIFTCRLGDGKRSVISLCKGRAPLTVDYRRGTIGGVESKIVFDRDKPIFRWVDVATYTTYFGFEQSRDSYVFGNPQEKFGARAFLEISKDGELVSMFRCHENSFGKKDYDSPAVIDVADEVVRGGGFEFPP